MVCEHQFFISLLFTPDQCRGPVPGQYPFVFYFYYISFVIFFSKFSWVSWAKG